MLSSSIFRRACKISKGFGGHTQASLRGFAAAVPRKRPDPITLTENAANRIRELLSEKTDAVGVRIGVKRRGCNGYSYTMNYADQEYVDNTKDEKVLSHGVQVLVDPKAIFFLVGTEMDFVETTLSSEFTFTNPNSKGSCGCGESFNV
mmetsp:Transcript_46465/g.92030  ORF Transcript_46465/g.92030 Transcript_46465/m.92030 type:complete len:148 (+) Transcript_46465:69-512(+)